MTFITVRGLACHEKRVEIEFSELIENTINLKLVIYDA